MILRFRMLSDENDNFVRDFEVEPMMKLSEFHNFIIRSLGYDDCMASFFTADDEWQRCREFTLMDMGDTGYEGEDAPHTARGKKKSQKGISDYPSCFIHQFFLPPFFQNTTAYTMTSTPSMLVIMSTV